MKRKFLFLLLIIFISGTIYAQVKIEGQVTNFSGEALPGVNISIKGTTTGTVTNMDGYYSISDVPIGSILVFSFIGMLTEEAVVDSKTQIDMVLVEDIQSLDQIVVIGYGTVKRRDLTGAVSSVKSEDIVISPTFNAMEAIQGKVAGVDITRNSGSAGSGVNITVRGNRSIGDPDDVDRFRDLNRPLFIIDGIQGGSFEDLNSNDIESIEVLKDASSTAIYGYQGANGVILITTKKAKAGKTNVSYNGYYGINGLTPYPAGRLKEDYIKLRREAFRANNTYTTDEAMFTSYQWDAIQNDEWVNWTDLLLNDGTIQNHQLSVSGGNEKTKSYLSAGYFKEVGPLKDDFSKYSFRVNIDHTINKWVNAGVQAQLGYTDQNARKDALSKANSATPLGTPYTEDGDIIIYPIAGESASLSPLTDLRLNAAVDNRITTRVFTTGYFEVKPLKGLTFRSNIGINLFNRRNGVFNDTSSMAQINTKMNTAEKYAENSHNINWDNVLTYNKDMDWHSFTITALSSYTFYEMDNITASGTGQQLTSSLYHSLQGTDATSRTIESDYIQTKTISVAGRINYNILGKYLLTASYRKDGASRLAPGHKWASFPSVAFAWRIGDETFIKSIDFISNLKLRGSYGVSGIATVPAYGTQSSIIPANNMSFGEVSAPAYSFSELLSSYELEWERAATLNGGIDIGLFENRFSIVIDAYKTITKGNLFNRALPVSAGGMASGSTTFSIWQNIGETENKGIELEINSTNINAGDFRWTSSLSYSRNSEKITKLIDDQDIISGTNPEENSLLIGHPIRSFYNYEKLGIWQTEDTEGLALYTDFEPGDIKLADLNGDTAITATDDRKYIGSAVPDWTLGFQNTFTYKGFDLNIYLFARWGQMIKNELLGRYNPAGTGNGPAYLDYWTPENPTNDFPRPLQGAQLSGYTGYTTLTYVDGSYFKIKNLTLGYTLPKKISSKILIGNLRVYATASNLLTVAKSPLVKYYDPENSGSEKAPMSKQIVFGVNVDF